MKEMLSGRLGQGVAIVLAALVGAGVSYLVLRRPPAEMPLVNPGPTTCERAFAATADINAYLEQRSSNSPTMVGHPLEGVAEDELDAAWASYIAESSQHMQETVNGFTTTYGGEVQFLVDEFVKAGAWGDEGEPTEVIVVNEIGIRYLATQLDAAALQAGCARLASAQP